MLSSKNIKDIYKLSPMQEGMYFQHLYDKASHAYFEQTSYRINGDLQVETVERSLNELLKRHDVLRTVFNHQKTGQPLQVVLKEASIDFHYEDASGVADKEAYVEQYKQRDIERGFDLNKDLLIRVGILRLGPAEYEFIWSHHHIIMDGWCVGILIAEYLEIYTSLLENRPARLGPVKPYKRYISWLGNQDPEASKGYWKHYLRGYAEAVGVPRTKGTEAEKAFTPEVTPLRLSKAKTAGLQELAARKGVTLNTLIQGLWSVLLFKYNDVRDAVFGAVVSGRPSELEGVESMVGLFINTVPVRVQYEPGMRFAELLSAVQRKGLESERYQYYPLAAIQAESELRQNTINHLLIFENFPLTRQIEESSARQTEEAPDDALRLSRIKTFAQTPYHFQLTILPGPELEVLFQYNAHAYQPDCVAVVGRHFEYLVDQALAHDAGFDIDELSLTGPQDTQLLAQFNATQADYPAGKTIVRLFEEQAEKTPHALALLLEERVLTYRDLNRQANRLAHLLRESYGVTAGRVVGLMTDRTDALLVGLLGSLKAGAAFVPIDPQLPDARIEYLVGDSKPDVLLTVGAHAKRAGKLATPVLLDREIAGGNDDNPAGAAPADLAYVIYTSGSTGRPKGVKISHRALVNAVVGIQRALGTQPDDRLLTITSCSFDPMLLDLFMPLITGACIILVHDEKLKDPVALQGIIGKARPTLMQATPTMWNALLSSGWEGDANLKVLCGGEDLNRELARRLLQASAALWNLYGPTETTIWSTVQRIGANDPNLPVGRPIHNMQVYVVDSRLRQQPVGVYGEICIGGDSVGEGYLNQPDLTAEKFIDNPFAPGTRLYRTGDVGRWLPDGTLEFIGRRDSQVKIMGNRIELGEIEATLMQYEAVENAAVIAWREEGAPLRLAAYFTGKGKIDVNALRNFLAEVLPASLVPTYLVQLDAFPLTTSKKIDRKALPAPRATGAERAAAYVAPRTETEARVAQLVAEALGTAKIGVHDNFFDYGLHSLTAIRLVHRIGKELNARLNVPVVFANPTVARLCGALRPDEEAEATDITPVAERPYYDLSHAQKRMWILHQFEENRAAYNVANAFRLKGPLDREAFARAFDTLIRRHESTRTTFVTVDGEPRQRINPYEPGRYGVAYEDLRAHPDQDALVRQRVGEATTTPFDLENGPLIRIRLLREADEQYVFSLVMHHIISDGWSLEVLVQEILTLYAAYTEGKENPLPPLRLQYKDYSAWQNARLSNERLKEHQQYWWNRFAGPVPVLELPTDYSRPTVRTANGAYTGATLGKPLRDALQALSQEGQASLYMTLMASVKLLLHKYSGQEDIVVGSAVAGRSHKELYNQIGFFVNTVALRTAFTGEEDFRSLLGKVKETILGAFEHQSYPFDRLVDDLKLPRNMSRSPLYDVMVSLHNTDVEDAGVPGLKGIEVETYENAVISKYDLIFHFKEVGDRIALTVEYNTDLFLPATVQRMVAHYLSLLEGLVHQAGTPIRNLSYLLPAEKEQLLAALQGPQPAEAPGASVHEQFAARAAADPQAVALRVENRTITYADLDRRANKLANYLIGRYGVQPGDVVAIDAAKPESLVVVMLAVLKAGAAYLPLGADLPADQAAYIAQHQALRAVVSESGREQAGTAALVQLAEAWGEIALCPDENPRRRQPVASVQYLFAAGDQPRRVVVSHGDLLAEAAWLREQYGLSAGDTVLPAEGLQAEAFARRCLAALVTGAGLVLPAARHRPGAGTLLSYVSRYAVTTLFVNSVGYADFLNTLAGAPADKTKSLRCVVVAGELLPREVLQRHAAELPVPLHLEYTFDGAPGRLAYRYGPEANRVMPLGRPIAGARLCLLDKFGNPVPPGVVGELYALEPGAALPAPDASGAAGLVGDALAGGQLLRTGSVGRWQPGPAGDAEIEIYGNAAHSLPVSSSRMHCHQAANTLLGHGRVEHAVVLVRKDAEAKNQLVAYYTSYDGEDIADLPAYFAALYPAYLVPAHFVRVDGFLLAANGKIDLAALPVPRDLDARAGTAYVAPRTELEEKLARMLMEVMGIEKLGVHENFFDSGFHSLKAIYLIGRIYKEFGLQLNMAKIFANPSVAGLARLIEPAAPPAVAGPPAAPAHQPVTT